VTTKKTLRLEREIQRLRTSPSYRLGLHLTGAIRKPWKAPFLFITLPLLMLRIGLELIGTLPPPRSLRLNDAGRSVQHGNCVVMFPTNGVGFGHFTRMLALAKRMKAQDPDLEIIFFTTMPTLHLLKPYGIPAHYISGPTFFAGLDSESWNALLEEELNLCLEIHRPSMFIFDGAFPYRGMLRAIQDRPSIKKIWMRRGMFRKGAKIPVDSIQFFDLIVRPGDGLDDGDGELDHGVEIVRCPPITLLDKTELLSREQARYRLGIPLDCTAVYVQLGAGQINDITSEIRMTVDELLTIEGLHVILGESMLGSRIEFNLPRVHVLRDYPNSQFFNGFDAVIQAAGYNSYHETRIFGVPAMFYPNMETGMDDQLARCQNAEDEGWGCVVVERTKQNIKDGVGALMKLPKESSIVDVENGASVISRILLKQLEREG
jgi:UDP-N-acetylglucosamine--N-acetylmuramyl-(pentapeptide) pyrophosphoryl-undecaprenol N-acetylglucosamine transferase